MSKRESPPEETSPDDSQEAMFEEEDDDCDCDLQIIRFDCKEKNCQCPDVVRSEGCGIRLDTRGRDEVMIGYTAVANDSEGSFTVKRIQPDKKDIVTDGQLVCSDGDCGEVSKCVEVFEVQAAGRPFALSSLTLSSKLRPFSEREIYEVSFYCDEDDDGEDDDGEDDDGEDDDGCDDSIQIPVYDGDLIKMCYNFGYNQAGIDFWNPTPANPIPSGRLSFRQFSAMLGENGARALFEKYYNSATRCNRELKNHCWLACMSSVLAEEFYKAFVEGIRPGEWGAFFAQPDVEITSASMPKTLEKLGDLFGKAHLRRGLKQTLEKCGNDPCLVDDLVEAAETLVQAQEDILTNYTFAVGGSIFHIFKEVIGGDPVTAFEKELHQQMIDGLNDAGKTDQAQQLQARWP